jgi:hypothetical protein
LAGCGDEIVKITIDLTAQEVAALKQFTKLEDAAEAVAKAAREFLRLSRLRELKAVCGKLECADNWGELEKLDLGETHFDPLPDLKHCRPDE